MSTSGRTVLYADDHYTEIEPDIQSLRDAGFDVLDCENAEELIQLIDPHLAQLECVIIDMILGSESRYTAEESEQSRRTGELLYADIRGSYPTLPIILVSRDGVRLERFAEQRKEQIDSDKHFRMAMRLELSPKNLVGLVHELTDRSAIPPPAPTALGASGVREVLHDSAPHPSPRILIGGTFRKFSHWLRHWLRDHGLWKLLEKCVDGAGEHWRKVLGSGIFSFIGSHLMSVTWHLLWSYSVFIGLGIFAISLVVWDYLSGRRR